MRLRVRDIGFFGAALLATIFFACPPLRAANIVVNTTADTHNNANCSLRDAITNANNDNTSGSTACLAGSGADSIDLTGVAGQITLTSPLPIIQNDLAIFGPGAAILTVSGNDKFRIFVVETSSLSISDLTIAHGYSRGGDGGDGLGGGGGGGAGAGAGLWALFTNVSLNSVTFDSNQAIGGTGGVSTGSGQAAGGGGGGIDGATGQNADSTTGTGGKGGDTPASFYATTGGAGGTCGPDVSGGAGDNGVGSGGAGACAGSFAGTAGLFFGSGGGGGNAFNPGGAGSTYAGGGGGNGGGAGGKDFQGDTLGGAGGSNNATAGGGGGGGAGIGGAIWAADVNMTLSSCTFTNNHASGGVGAFGDFQFGSNGLGKGGAIFIDFDDPANSSVTQNCGNVFIGNVALDQAGTPTDNNDVFGDIGTSSDTTNPVITCPADQLAVPNTAGLCSAVVNPGTATATDNCGIASINGVRSDALPLTDPYPVGTTFITWTATDTSGNTDVCLQTIVVQDKENPVITCVAPVTANADASCQATVPNMVASVSDNCPGVQVVQTPAAGTVETGAATYPVHIVATDASGNTAFCDTSFTVKDVTPPVVTSSEVIHILSSDHTLKDIIFSASAVDNCDGVLPTTVQIYANENEEVKTSSGDARTSPDARGIGTAYNYGNWYNRLGLRQERLNNGQGRVYLIKVSATDTSGNTGYSCSYVISPKSSKRLDIQKAQTLGDAVVGPCNATGLVPLNYQLNPIGFGPVIGSKQ